MRADGLGKTFGDHPKRRMAGANAVRSQRLSGSGAPNAKHLSGALSSNIEGRLIAPSARSECLDESDGGPNAASIANGTASGKQPLRAATNAGAAGRL